MRTIRERVRLFRAAYHVMHVYHEVAVFQAVRYALWLSAGR